MSKPDLKALSTGTVLDPDGTVVKISTLWAEHPVVLVFLRHFACIACRAHAEKIWKERSQFEALGAQLVFIGNGLPHFIESFKEDLGLQGSQIFTDPGLSLYKAAGLERSLLATAGPSALGNLLKLRREGFKAAVIGPGVGDVLQQGGVVAIDTQGEVVYQFVSKYQGHCPSPEETQQLLAILAPPPSRQKRSKASTTART